MGTTCELSVGSSSRFVLTVCGCLCAKISIPRWSSHSWKAVGTAAHMYRVYVCNAYHSVALPCRPTRILLGANLSKREHHLQVCSVDCPSHNSVQAYQLREAMWLTTIGIPRFHQMKGAIQEKSSASRSSLKPERAGVDADRTALQPDCRKGHSCLHVIRYVANNGLFRDVEHLIVQT